MLVSTNIEHLLHAIDEARQNWLQKFTIPNNELTEDIRKLLSNCTKTLIRLSISIDDNDEVKENRIDAEPIVLKLKQLRHDLGVLWLPTMNSFVRDVFDVGSYHIAAAEFFQPIQFYPTMNLLMKLYRWSVYNTNGIILHQYHLEKSEMILGEPYYVLRKSDSNGHAQIQPYGAVLPHYDHMKAHVINDLIGQGSSPIISLVTSSPRH